MTIANVRGYCTNQAFSGVPVRRMGKLWMQQQTDSQIRKIWEGMESSRPGLPTGSLRGRQIGGEQGDKSRGAGAAQCGAVRWPVSSSKLHFLTGRARGGRRQ